MQIEIEEVKKIITEAYGFEVREKSTDRLNRFIQQRSSVNGFDVPNYLKWIKNTESERQELIENLVVNETYFFRNPMQFQYLEEVVVPELVQKQPLWRWDAGGIKLPKIRILSAACATGEEPYSIAMSLMEKIKYPRGWDIMIDAFDVSSHVLDIARKGEYSLTDRMKTSLEQMNGEYLMKYFLFDDCRCKVATEIRNLIRFFQGNLKKMFSVSPVLLPKYDVIFCRNVMIYFGFEDQQNLVRFLENSLEDGGYLMMGDAESLHLYEHGLELARTSSGLVYQKTYHHSSN